MLTDSRDPRDRQGSMLVVAAALVAALLAGSVTALTGTIAGDRAVYLVAVPLAIAVGVAVALTRPQPLRFLLLLLLGILPFSSILVPPGRLSLTVFDVATIVLAVGLLFHKAFRSDPDAPLFPAPALGWMWLLLIPCAAFARHPAEALRDLALIFCAYVFFWFVLQELRRPGGMTRLVVLLCLSTLVVALGLFIDHTFQVNLSLRGSNPNQLTFSAGRYIWRAGGFFQDPQKAAAFLASALIFLLVLGIRGRFGGTWMRALLWSAIAVGMAAMFLTVSRASILSFIVVAAVALVAVNRWPLALKLAGIGGFTVVVASIVMAPEFWIGLLPARLSERVAQSQEEFQARVEIWFNTWEMFTHHPVTGIGFGGFQQYLLDTRPGTTDYFGTYEYTGMSYVPDHPENGYLKILYETGIIGSIAVLLLVGASLRRALVALRGGDANRRSEVVAALASLAVFAGAYLTLFTTGDPRLLALFAIMLAVLWQPLAPFNPRPRS